MAMTYFRDPLVRLIIVLILCSLAAYLGGIFVYPFGLLVLLVFLLARIAFLRSGKT